MPELLDPAVLSRIRNYQLMARLAVDGYLSGLHRSRFHGFGTEFLQYRNYTPGEDLRTVDWKAYARRGRLQTKVYQEETQMQLHLVLDSSASMGYQGRSAPCSKFEYAARLAAVLAHMAHRQGDAVGLVVYNETLRDVVPPSNRNQRLVRLFQILSSIQPEGGSVHELPFEFVGHHLSGRSFVVFLSDMLEEAHVLPDLFSRVRIRHNDCLAIQVLDPDEKDLPEEDSARFVDMESSAEILTSPKSIAESLQKSMDSHIAELAARFQQSRIDFRSLTSRSNLGHALSWLLRHRGPGKTKGTGGC